MPFIVFDHKNASSFDIPIEAQAEMITRIDRDYPPYVTRIPSIYDVESRQCFNGVDECIDYLSKVGRSDVPTEAPAEVPTEAPAEVPTEAPVEVPTEAPAEVPAEEPVKEPTKAPAKKTAKKPAKEPTNAVSDAGETSTHAAALHDVSEGVPEAVSEAVSETVPEAVSEAVSEPPKKKTARRKKVSVVAS